MRRLALATLFYVVFALPAFGDCTFGSGTAFCDPDLPGVDLPIELEAVRITDFAVRDGGAGRWLVDLTLATTDHPGEIRVYSWRWGLLHSEKWVAAAGSSGSRNIQAIDAGPTDPAHHGYGAHAVAVEWHAGGSTWKRVMQLHRGPSNTPEIRAGAYYFTASEGRALHWLPE